MSKTIKTYLSLIIISLIFLTCSKDSNPVSPPEESDEILPSIGIQNPTSEISYATLDNSITLSGIASDNKELKSITWSSSSGLSGEATGLENWTIPDISLDVGDNIITVTAIDKADNSNSIEIIITNNEFIDYLDRPNASHSGVFVNTATDVLLKLSIAPNPNLIPNTVKLVRLDDNNDITSELNQLFDNGNLANGDDIQGDGVFSTFQSFDEPAVGKQKFRITAKSIENGIEIQENSAIFLIETFEQLQDQDYEIVKNIQIEAFNQLNNNIQNSELEQAVTQTLEWLKEQPDVLDASLTDAGYVEIEYQSGLAGGLIISEEDENGIITLKGGIGKERRSQKTKISQNRQTVGINETGRNKLTNTDNENLIIDKDVLIFAPFEDVFAPDMRPSLTTIFQNSEIEFNIVSLIDQQCTIESLNNLTDYGTVIFDTHGSGGEHILTGELVTDENKKNYALLLREKKIRIWTDIVYSKVLLFFNRKADLYGVTSKFINSLSGKFPNSLIFNGSCESTQTSNLSNAFRNKGAKAYFGFDKIVNTTFCRDMSDDIFQSMTIDLKSTGEAFTSGQMDPVSPNAEFELYGSQDLKFTLSLINGDFEFGDLTGWSKYGDGRVITQLSSQLPTQETFMGIISTGLGFTTSTGGIFQSFKVLPGETNLSLKWNFLSEEFLEYVGSQYQDFFKISVRTPTGSEIVIFEKAIDQFAAEYNLVLVSPNIVFDRGDVYMTGWQILTYDLSAYENQTLTLILSAGDIGDSIYDSAILLDEIKVGSNPLY